MNIRTFRVQRNIDGIDVVLFPTLVEIRGKLYLVDCGYAETFPEFVNGLRDLELEIRDLHAILVSHDDIDHLGALAQFRELNPDIRIYCSETEAASVSGKIPSERLEQAERSLPHLPEEHRPWALRFIEQLKNIPRLPVDITLQDHDRIDGELEVICTPGHTKGHISLYSPADNTLIANDALVIEDDNFEIANPMFTLDMPQAIRSVERIKEIDPARIICYHGGIAEDNIPQKLTRLLEKYDSYR